MNPDTGSSGHFISVSDSIHLDNLSTARQPVSVRLPDGSVCHSTHVGHLRIPSLSPTARLAHVFPGFTGSLLSIGQLCDAGYSALYTVKDVTILDALGQPALRGIRAADSGLWSPDISDPLPPPVPPSLAAATKLVPSTKRGLVEFYYRSLGAPPAPTFRRAFLAGYLPLPGLTAKMVARYLPDLPATAKGHLNRSRQGLYSSRVASQAVETGAEDWDDPAPSASLGSPVNLTIKLIETMQGGITHGDLTGKFPVTSRKGSAYVMILLHEELNYIHAEPMRDRGKKEYLRAFEAGLEYFKLRGIPVTTHRLDNEASGDLLTYCKRPDVAITLQFVPPDCHRANRAERAIRTWKNHFVTHLCLLDPHCPLDLWDKYLEQAEMTLNLVRACGLNIKVSAWAFLRGPWSFTATPIAPLGTKVVVFEDPKTRPSWATHGVDGWYVGPAFNHFHEFTVFIPSTGGYRTTNTLSWYPHDNWSVPHNEHSSLVTSLLDTLSTAITALAPTGIASDSFVQATSALTSLRSLFMDGVSQRVTDQPSVPPQRVADQSAIPPQREADQSAIPPQRVVLTPDAIAPTLPAVVHPVAPLQQPTPSQPKPKSSAKRRHTAAPSRSSARRRQRTLRYASKATKISPCAFTSVDMGADGSVLTYRAAMRGEDKAQWEKAAAEEFHRLIKTWECMSFQPHTELPRDRLASYYNPQVKRLSMVLPSTVYGAPTVATALTTPVTSLHTPRTWPPSSVTSTPPCPRRGHAT